jgi:hypothetical protein
MRGRHEEEEEERLSTRKIKLDIFTIKMQASKQHGSFHVCVQIDPFPPHQFSTAEMGKKRREEDSSREKRRTRY